MNREQIKKFILDNFKDKLKSNSCSITIRFKHKDILQDIIRETKYLTKNFNERLYHIINDLYEIPKCKCGKTLTFLSFDEGYRKHCKSCLKTYGFKFENKDKILCSHGCGRLANFKFLKTFCCESYVSKCPALINKSKRPGNKNGMFGKKSRKRYTIEKLKEKHPILFEYENIREISPGEFEVTCKKCNKWFKVNFGSLKTRALALEKWNKNHFLFCSKDCAESSGIYRLQSDPEISNKYSEYQKRVYTSYEQKAGGFNHPDECSFKKF